VSRAEMATVLAVALTLAADAVAMARHPSVWAGKPAGYAYAAALIVLELSTAWVGARVLRSTGTKAPRDARPGRAATAALAAFFIALALYPESVARANIPGALATVVVGIALLFVPLRFLLVALVPSDGGPPAQGPLRHGAPGRRVWVSVAVTGLLIGLGLVAAESGEGLGGIPFVRLALVAAVYVGLETVGLLVGYGALGRPLRLFDRE
jgi:hypothetical protein